MTPRSNHTPPIPYDPDLRAALTTQYVPTQPLRRAKRTKKTLAMTAFAAFLLTGTLGGLTFMLTNPRALPTAQSAHPAPVMNNPMDKSFEFTVKSINKALSDKKSTTSAPGATSSYSTRIHGAPPHLSSYLHARFGRARAA